MKSQLHWLHTLTRGSSQYTAHTDDSWLLSVHCTHWWLVAPVSILHTLTTRGSSQYTAHTDDSWHLSVHCMHTLKIHGSCQYTAWTLTICGSCQYTAWTLTIRGSCQYTAWTLTICGSCMYTACTHWRFVAPVSTLQKANYHCRLIVPPRSRGQKSNLKRKFLSRTAHSARFHEIVREQIHISASIANTLSFVKL